MKVRHMFDVLQQVSSVLHLVRMTEVRADNVYVPHYSYFIFVLYLIYREVVG